MPKGTVAKSLKRAKNTMSRGKGHFIRNDPHGQDKVRMRNDDTRQLHTNVLPTIPDERDKRAVIIIDKLIRENKYRYKVDGNNTDRTEMIIKLCEQNLHIPYIKMIYDLSEYERYLEWY
tara:strand:- start:1758 stop:2114 length:357 start_codon:yes stop_codon:yes gene_type:complete